jgi:hypothetical protein
MVLRFLMLMLCIGLAGCATQNGDQIARLDKWDNKKYALIVGSYGEEGNKYIAGDINFSLKPADEKLMPLQLRFNPYATGVYDDFGKSQRKRGGVFVSTILPGKYTLSRWGYSWALNDYWYEPKAALPQSLDIKAGEVVYIGNVTFLMLTGENAFGMDVIGGAVPVVSDEYDRDMKMIREKYMAISDQNVRKSLLIIKPPKK